MDSVAIFTTNNCRLIMNPPDLEEYRNNPNAVINPDLSLVRKLPPHFWKLDQGKIIPMLPAEREEVLKHHEAHGVDNAHPVRKTRTVPQQIKHQKKINKVRLALSVAMGGGVVELAHLIAHYL